jgi:hypothetical protein
MSLAYPFLIMCKMEDYIRVKYHKMKIGMCPDVYGFRDRKQKIINR